MSAENRGFSGRISAEMITAISAMFIGVCALAVSLYEASLIREHQRASVWPNVELGYTYNQDGLSMIIANTGIGPARIRHLAVEVDGQPIEHWGEMFERFELPGENYLVTHVSRRVIPPNTELHMLKVNPTGPIDELYRQSHRLSIRTCYCSVYEECWQMEFGESSTPVVACPDMDALDL